MGLDADKLTIPAAIGGAFVRLRGVHNSEIVGKFTQSSFDVVFQNNETAPTTSAQLYEAFGYVLLFFLLRWLYRQNKTQRVFAEVYFIGIFTIRFLVNQKQGFEKYFPYSVPVNG